MNWILLVMAAIVAVGLAMLAGGAMAPRERVAARALTTPCPAADLFALLRAADGPPRWCANLPAMRVVHESPPATVHFELVTDDGAPMGTWTVHVTEMAQGSKATIVEAVAVPNLLLRFVRSIGGNGARPERFLVAVARELGVPATVDTPTSS
ncbi:hypothetical protein [Gemmatimonas sp.]|jgi:hypothetical protein|uniref:hypothetical protein n=1 Tax=Gemmatimonas sp. TaxID=1962908 RepID=UPI0037BFED8F